MGMTVDYNTHFKDLEKVIATIDRPGAYCTHDRRIVYTPTLEVGEVGIIAFPLLESQIKSMIVEAERAPYGKGEETLLDSSVRNCWQVNADKVKIGGPKWKETFANILGSVAAGLGCDRSRLSAELYKLLIYEKGGFFVAHRDTEKCDGMVATLVIALPTFGLGGELIVRHKGEETIIDMRGEGPGELSYAAFYADCEHEVMIVEEGHRVCLVYNLILSGSESGTELVAPDFDKQHRQLAQILSDSDRWEPDMKLVWILEHDYSEAGLSFNILKNKDASVAKAFLWASKQAGLSIHATTLHIREGASYDDHYDYDDDISDPDPEYEPLEIYDRSMWLENWVSASGDRPDFGKVPLADEELLPEDALGDALPDEQRVHEAMGNGGASLERSYRITALAIWPESQTFRVFAKAGLANLLGYIESLIRKADQEPSMRESVREVLLNTIRGWEELERVFTYLGAGSDNKVALARTGLSLADGFKDASVNSELLSGVVISRYSGELNDSLLEVMLATDPGDLGEFIAELGETWFSDYPREMVALMNSLQDRVDLRSGSAWTDLFRRWLNSMMRSLPQLARNSVPKQADRWSEPPDPVTLDAATIHVLMRSLWRFGMDGTARLFVEFLTEAPTVADPHREIAVAIEGICAVPIVGTGGYAAGLRELILYSANNLLARSGEPPPPPHDWIIPPRDLACNCDWCSKVREFCGDPESPELRIKATKHYRVHVEGEIRYAKLDVALSTVTEGLPYTLVCTKTRGADPGILRRYKSDIEAMKQIMGASALVSDEEQLFKDLRLAIVKS